MQIQSPKPHPQSTESAVEMGTRRVQEIWKLLGLPAVLLPIPKGAKVPATQDKGWQHYGQEQMESPEYLTRFANGCNIGVVLGKASAGVCSIDLDEDDLLEPFLAANPRLRGTLRTRRARGCNLWVRIKGRFPRLKPFHHARMKNTKGKPLQIGEWRADGGQTVLAGEAGGLPYQIAVPADPLALRFDEINWPDWIKDPPSQAAKKTEMKAEKPSTNEILGNLDEAKLENFQRHADGSIKAACPACRAIGEDSNGDHLLVFPDGKFGCAKYQDDPEHRKAIWKLARTERGNIDQAHRPLKVTPPATLMSFEAWREVIMAHFPAYARPAEICASTVAQLLLNDVANPFALALVDVPSSGKTITLNFFDIPELAYTTDNFTPASFVSHASNVKREELAKVDMLPRIRYRTLIVRDLAPVFGVKEDELLKTMGILTRALDGEGLETDSGVHGKRGYKGDWLFMLLAGTTPIPPRVFKVMGTLGSRLFFLALHPNSKSHAELIAQNRGKSRQEKERVCREATDLLLRTLWSANPVGIDWNKDGDPEDCLRVIARCAELLASLRGAIQIWHNEQDGSANHNMPVIEQPDRINCLLYNLARGHALLCGRTQITETDLAPVMEVTFDSAPTIRSKVFRALLDHGGTLRTSQLEKILRCSKPTALREMEALAVLGVGDKAEAEPEYGRPEHELRLTRKFEWFASNEREAVCWQSQQPQAGNP